MTYKYDTVSFVFCLNDLSRELLYTHVILISILTLWKHSNREVAFSSDISGTNLVYSSITLRSNVQCRQIFARVCNGHAANVLNTGMRPTWGHVAAAGLPVLLRPAGVQLVSRREATFSARRAPCRYLSISRPALTESRQTPATATTSAVNVWSCQAHLSSPGSAVTHHSATPARRTPPARACDVTTGIYRRRAAAGVRLRPRRKAVFIY